MDTESSGKLDLSSLGSFDFTPDWAKKGAGVSVGKFRPDRAEAPRRGDGPRGDAPSRGFGDASRPRGERKPFGERKGFGERKPFGDAPSRGFGAAGRPQSDRKFGDRKTFGDRPARRNFGGGGFEPRPQPLDVEVKVLPETKALGTIIRKIQGDTHAYKLKDLAYFFLDNPQSILLKISPKASGDSASPTSQPLNPSTSQPFFQCKACGFASLSRAEVEEHVLTAHIGDYFVAKEVDCEPPKGNFNCVAKCGLTGVFLGPPNIHEFNAVVKEMIRTKFPQMSEEQYRAHIVMVRDADAIEQWRQGATKKTVFFAKGTENTEGAPSLSREQVEGEFRRTILASLVDSPKNLMITADMALKSPVRPLVWAARDAVEAERRAPYAMCFALRGAFHHRKLNFFRTNDSRGQEFVTSVSYKAFDAAHAIPELAKVATFVAEHPCCSLREAAPDAETEKHLAWLVSTGHVVSFTNGVYSPVEKFPKYGPQWRKKQEKVRGEGEGEQRAESPVDAVSSPRQEEPVDAVSSPRQEEPVDAVSSPRQEEPVDAVSSPRQEEPVDAVSSPRQETISEEKKEDEAAAQLAE